MRRLSLLLMGLTLCGFMPMSALAQVKKDDPKVYAPTKPVEPLFQPGIVEVFTPPVAPGPSFRHLDGRRLLFVANGVNGSSVASDNLIEISHDLNLGLKVQMIGWSRTNSVFADLIDREAQARAAHGLAHLAQHVRNDCPHSPIYFVGHSAGAHVVLMAAAMMPDKSVDRIILMHAAVSCVYDLKPALRASRYGIDNFWSSEDSVLDSAIQHATTADGTKFPCAGRIGFRLPTPSPDDWAAYRNVRQYRWKEELSGNGGHYAWTLQANLKKCVVPLFFSYPPVFQTPLILPHPMPAVINVPPIK